MSYEQVTERDIDCLCGLPEISATKKQNDIPMVSINRWDRVSEEAIDAIVEFSRSCSGGESRRCKEGKQPPELLKETCQGTSA